MSNYMADAVANVSLQGQRKDHCDIELMQWRAGRAHAAASIYPTPENLSAANECEFLIEYVRRHNRSRK